MVQDSELSQAISHIVFWQNAISMHQTGLLESVARALPGRVSLVVDQPFNKAREDQGWDSKLPRGVEVVSAPDSEQIVDIVRSTSSLSAHHVFSGFSAYPTVSAGLRVAIETDALISIYSERPDTRALHRRLFAFCRGKLQAARFRKRLHRILAVGDSGKLHFESVGFSKAQVVPFGYFHRCGTSEVSNRDAGFGIVLVARQVGLKRIDLLLKQLAHLKDLPWKLTIVGDGPMRETNERLCQSLQLEDRIRMLGTLRHHEVIHTIASNDLLVLPSSYDGWGAVVNEALATGTPAIVSDACGVSSVMASRMCGDVFQSGNGEELRECLGRRIENGPITQEQRGRLVDWYDSTLSPEAGASYLIDVLTNADARPPWSQHVIGNLN